jgi:hypothetical protein
VRAPRSREPRARAALAIVTFALLSIAPFAAIVSAVVACTDGVTPDCSDAATQCGPDIDGAADLLEAQPLPESSAPDAPADTSVPQPDGGDPDADAGDEI